MGRPTPVTPSQELEIVALYLQGVSRNELALRFKASRWFITDCLHRHNVTMRTVQERCPGLPVNHHAFDDAESDPEAAYWVGFLMADGCISLNGGHGSSHVILALAEVDESHVLAFRSFLRSEHKVQRIPAAAGREIKSGPSIRLDIVSAQLTSALSRYGVVPNKTLRTCVAGLEHDRDFWRGVVDGDGWVGKSTRRTGPRVGYEIPRINITGSHTLLSQWSTFMRSITPCAGSVLRDGTVWQCPTSGRHAIRLMDALYSGCSTALPRKQESARILLDRYAFLCDPKIGYHWSDEG